MESNGNMRIDLKHTIISKMDMDLKRTILSKEDEKIEMG
jgi:hypothetical protein